MSSAMSRCLLGVYSVCYVLPARGLSHGRVEGVRREALDLKLLQQLAVPHTHTLALTRTYRASARSMASGGERHTTKRSNCMPNVSNALQWTPWGPHRYIHICVMWRKRIDMSVGSIPSETRKTL
ncbi:hypothetical protein V8C86DRAFT_1279229 [Haematococcus lacustris]